ncbi:hypothetical protein N7510_007982 [Penicillium lagena]|uniref:uncharacterized protein n=1 Tax=Penicillium lagena TaxID=94218 RepID=UPI0025415226|nr:uncharacterized protein N7510_007982 [Penicillium lagena]KAJ5611263.1 hypothetical protein N7510_007982 [Penicillium lagena]
MISSRLFARVLQQVPRQYSRPKYLPVGEARESSIVTTKEEFASLNRKFGNHTFPTASLSDCPSSPKEALDNASNMLGYYLTTKQTPSGGLLVNKLYIYKAVDIAKEFYLAVTFDREWYSPVLLISGDGGVNIESNTDNLHRFWFRLSEGVTPEIIASIQTLLHFNFHEMDILRPLIYQMAALFQEKDATLIELNPLVQTAEGDFVCLDAKFHFDNAAKFRQNEIFSLAERSPEEEEEHDAARLGLSYVRLDGNIGNIVNGAGLAMATNDLISIYGGKCANFLDIGGVLLRRRFQRRLRF